eukprot:TRINITY_DN10184_c0_g1_i1.p1 TRINITY_DN10184_c0_g1~~TRINITY_DN10184_c0_g1_i1.p1  ORF type:complete len:457 (+),score=155.27 TRINITY_DN10184_c0_g1_i1:37-1371(+)
MSVPNVAQITESVESLKEEIISSLLKYVSIDSTLNHESAAQDYIASVLSDNLGLKVERIPLETTPGQLKTQRGFSPVDWKYSNKETIIGTHTPSQTKGKSLILNGHTDVVPVDSGLDQWTNPPFDAVVRDGRLYGRGSGDMKGGIIAAIFAFKALQKLGYVPAANVYFETVVEEECTGNGCLSAFLNGPKADAVIIPEPFPWLVSAMLGVLWLQVEVRGKPAHVLDTRAGVNAIEAAVGFFKALAPLEEKYNSPEMRHPAFKEFSHPVNFNIGKIQGGDWASSVPAKAVIEIRLGLFPDQPIVDVQKEVETIFAQYVKDTYPNAALSYEVKYTGFQAEGCDLLKIDAATGEEDVKGQKALFDSVKKNYSEAAPGETIDVKPVTCTTDGRFFSLYGKTPVACFGPEANSIHGIDESVGLESLFRVCKVIALFMADWCGLEPVKKE